MSASVTCKGCNRIVYVAHVDTKGLCAYCHVIAPVVPKPELPKK